MSANSTITIHEAMHAAEYIGGLGYSFNRFEFDLPMEVSEAEVFVVADVHTYAREYFPLRDGQKPETWLLGGNYIKYCIFANGHLVGLGPARPVDDAPYVQCYALDGLHEGRNAVAVISMGELRGFAALIRVVLGDGSERVFATGTEWKSISGNEIFRPVAWDHPGVDNFFKGFPGPGELQQHIDGMLFPVGWDKAGFDDSAWHSAHTFGVVGHAYAEPDIPNLIHYRVHPERIIKRGDGHFFFDFGREVVASLRLNTPASPGRDIEIRLGEECSGPDEVRFQMRTQNCYQEIWKLGGEPAVLEHFGLRAFRYGEVIGWPGELGTESISATVVHYPFDDDASVFSSSDDVLNDVWNLCKYSIKATNMDLYQDCPSRERQAYEGDAYVCMLSHYALDSDTRLARHTAEYLLNHLTWPAEWIMLMVPIFWADYMQTGDLSLIEKYYERLRDDCSFHHNLTDGLRSDFGKRILVDWPESQLDGYEFGPVNTVANSYMYKDVVLLARMAEVLGRADEAKELAGIASQIKDAFNAKLFNAQTGLYVDHEGSNHSSFHANLFPLAFGLVPPERVHACLGFLKYKGMVCSVYASQFFLDALYDYGEAEYALGLLTAKGGNSWGHMIYDLHATITTESWDPEQKDNMSWAHPWATAPANIIARRLFGIRPVEPGWKKFEIKPQPASLSWAKIKVPTPKGTIEAGVERDSDGGFILRFSSPEGCRAIVDGREYCSGDCIKLRA